MTTKIQTKRNIKAKVGEDKYISFMAELTGSIHSLKEIGEKYNISENTLYQWCKTLGYRTGRERQQIRMDLRIKKRIKVRQENTQKLIQFLTNLKKG